MKVYIPFTLPELQVNIWQYLGKPQKKVPPPVVGPLRTFSIEIRTTSVGFFFAASLSRIRLISSRIRNSGSYLLFSLVISTIM